MPDVTYYVALPFVGSEDGPAAGEAVECHSSSAAMGKARTMSAQSQHVGAVAFSRTGDPMIGEFGDPTVLGKWGSVPDDLSGI